MPSTMTDSREILREASVALQGRIVTMWQVSSRASVVPVMTSTSDAAPEATTLDVDATLHRWGAPVIEGSRWIGCHMGSNGTWCVAPVRTRPPAPPPGGIERRSRERMTLELAGLCLGLMDRRVPSTPRPRLSEPDALLEWLRQPSVIAHEVANPLTAALASLELSLERLRRAPELTAALRDELLEELPGVAEGIDQAVAFLRAIQDRSRGALARSERFDALQVVRSCLTLERPLARRRGVALTGVIAGDPVFLQGDPNALYRSLANLIRNAVAASQVRHNPISVAMTPSGNMLRVTVADQGVGIAPENLDRIFEAGFTTQGFGAGSGTGLTVVRETVEEMFGGTVELESEIDRGTTFTLLLPIPPQRESR
jgi:anti-sigma regulatory factor (Ser/Thr protein kinase)